MTRTDSRSAPDLIIIGASARAACFSAVRAGLTPYWIDQFGDSDLRAAFAGTVVPARAYPAGLVPALERAPVAPVVYTGALENHPRVLKRIAAQRRLLGNSAAVCAQVRNPALLRERLAVHGIPCPHMLGAGEVVPPVGDWLHKPERSGGGLGISTAGAGGTHAAPGHYLQELVRGESFSGVYVADEANVRLLGVTRQLVGLAEFHAPPFSYCGSLGPVSPLPPVRAQWEQAGRALAQDFGLRGLYGVDAVVHDGRLTVIEVNPRYTASVEIIEAGLDVAAMDLHVSACGLVLQSRMPWVIARPDPNLFHGKVCLFAPADLVFDQAASDWCLERGRSACSDPCVEASADGTAVQFADVPSPGTPIAHGAPILTVLCRAGSLSACAGLLRHTAAGVYQALDSSVQDRAAALQRPV